MFGFVVLASLVGFCNTMADPAKATPGVFTLSEKWSVHQDTSFGIVSKHFWNEYCCEVDIFFANTLLIVARLTYICSKNIAYCCEVDISLVKTFPSSTTPTQMTTHNHHNPKTNTQTPHINTRITDQKTPHAKRSIQQINYTKPHSQPRQTTITRQ